MKKVLFAVDQINCNKNCSCFIQILVSLITIIKISFNRMGKTLITFGI
jgi:hypothetical protein